MNAGDIIFRLLADDRGFAADLNQKAGKAGTQAGATLGQKLSGGFKKAGSGLFAGIGIGAGVAAFGALDTAISSSIRFMADAVTAAREDEESQARLGASLKANIPNWDGNTRAIEQTIAARQKLGFADDEQRKSLTILIAATHDINKALAVQRVAMDLARIKGISLADASAALTKVEGGQFRALKALGIQLPKNATAQDALNAVTKVAKGSAEAYAKTSAGKLLASQIAVGEAMEKLGYVLMPIVTDAAVVLAGVVTDLAEALFGVGDEAQKAAPKTKGLFDELDEGLIKNTQREFKALGDIWHNLFGGGQTPLGQALADDLDAIGSAAVDLSSDARGMAASVAGSLDGLADDSESAGKRIRTVFGDVNEGYKAMRDEMTAAASGFADALWDPVEARAELATLELEAKRLRNVRDSKESSAEEKRQAIIDLDEVNKRHFEVLGILTSYGDTAAADALQTQINVLKATKNLTSEQKVLLAALEAQLRRARTAALGLNAALYQGRNQGGGFGGGKAGGGYVAPNMTYDVGEEGRERLTMFPGGGGFVESHGAIGSVPSASASSGGSGNTFHIYNPVPHAADEDIGRVLRRTAALGI